MSRGVIRHHPIHRTWQTMIQRCHNPNNTKYHLYGGRGIQVCQRWRTYANFLSDMGPRPPGTSIDRIDGDRGYEPGNCRWATPLEQGQNTSATKLNADKVREIRRRHAAGETTRKIAAAFDLDHAHVWRICAGKCWPNVAATEAVPEAVDEDETTPIPVVVDGQRYASLKDAR